MGLFALLCQFYLCFRSNSALKIERHLEGLSHYSTLSSASADGKENFATICEWSEESFFQASPRRLHVWHPNTSAFNAHNHVDLLSDSTFSSAFEKYSADAWKQSLDKYGGEPKMWSCVGTGSKEQSSHEVHRQRAGPFVTTGGESWTGLEAYDVGFLSSALSAHPTGISIVKSFLGPTDAQGRKIASPPIYLHHVFQVRGHSTFSYNVLSCAVFGMEDTCVGHEYTPMSLGSDSQCSEVDGGITCMEFKALPGLGFQIHKPTTLVTEILDLRKIFSEPLEWFFEINLEWVALDQESLRPLSLSVLYAPGITPTPSDPSVIFVPTSEESFSWCSFRIGFTGQVTHAHFHTHFFEGEGLYFNAEPKQLGLHKFQRTQPWDHIFTPRQAGFSYNSEVKQYIHQQLNTSRLTSDKQDVNLPSLQMWMEPKTEMLDEYGYRLQRKGAVHINPLWRPTKGDVLTQVLFFEPSTMIPELFQNKGRLTQHEMIWLYYDSSDGVYADTQVQWGHWDPQLSYFVNSKTEQMRNILYHQGILPPIKPLSWIDNKLIYFSILGTQLPSSFGAIVCVVLLSIAVAALSRSYWTRK